MPEVSAIPVQPPAAAAPAQQPKAPAKTNLRPAPSATRPAASIPIIAGVGNLSPPEKPEPALHARNAGLGSCTSAVERGSAAAIDAPHSAFSNWNPGAPNLHAFQSIAIETYQSRAVRGVGDPGEPFRDRMRCDFHSGVSIGAALHRRRKGHSEVIRSDRKTGWTSTVPEQRRRTSDPDADRRQWMRDHRRQRSICRRRSRGSDARSTGASAENFTISDVAGEMTGHGTSPRKCDLSVS